MTYLNEAVQGVFLLILAVAGNFVAETLGCKTQKLLSENMFAKHFIIISILYFAIDFSSGSNNPRPPWDTLKLTLVIYILFILFTKMSLTFSVIVFGMFITGYFINTYIEYYTKTDPKNPIIKKLQRTIQYMGNPNDDIHCLDASPSPNHIKDSKGKRPFSLPIEGSSIVESEQGSNESGRRQYEVNINTRTMPC